MSKIQLNQKITPFLWFDNNAEEAINHYVSIFPNSSIQVLKRWDANSPFPPDSSIYRDEISYQKNVAINIPLG